MWKCWACRAAIVAAVIALIAILANVAAVTAAVANAVQAVILALEVWAGITVTPIGVTAIVAGLGGLSLGLALDWLCCKLGGWCC